MTLKWSNFNPSGAVEWLSKLESRTGGPHCIPANYHIAFLGFAQPLAFLCL